MTNSSIMQMLRGRESPSRRKTNSPGSWQNIYGRLAPVLASQGRVILIRFAISRVILRRIWICLQASIRFSSIAAVILVTAAWTYWL